MTATEILGEIKALSFAEQSRIYEALRELVLKQMRPSPSPEPKENDLRRAASALRSDYESDPELTAFTALDGEDFHAAR
jgi:hypothetical protein